LRGLEGSDDRQEEERERKMKMIKREEESQQGRGGKGKRAKRIWWLWQQYGFCFKLQKFKFPSDNNVGTIQAYSINDDDTGFHFRNKVVFNGWF
jgi:hypothetical protein